MSKKYLQVTLTALVIALFCPASFAGSKGFRAVLINIGDQDFQRSPTYTTYIEKFETVGNDPCWNKMGLADGESGLELLIFKKRPPEMTIELGKAIWKADSAAISTARGALRKHPHDYDISEFHGLYIIKPEGNKISMMGVGINAGKGSDHGISQKIEIVIDPNNPKKSATAFEKGLCRVSKPFNIGFSV